MRLGIKAKQVLGVTSIVGVVVLVLSALHLARLAQVSLEESRARAELLASAIFHRAREVVGTGDNSYKALAADPGLRSILESALYSKNVTFAAIVDNRGVIVAHADRSLEGQTLPPGGSLTALVGRSPLSQLVAIYSGQGRNLELRQPLLLGDTEFGSIHIGVSTLLIRQDLDASLRPAISISLAALAVSVIVAMLLAQLLLRPIHVIRSGLTRLGRGEFGVRLDLNQRDEFGELGTFFNAVSAQISADRSQMAGQVANLESAVQHLEDAVAIVNPRGELLFANPAMRALLPEASPGASVADLLGPDHPLLRLSEQTLISGESRGPLSATFPRRPESPSGDNGAEAAASAVGERLVMSHAINDPDGARVGIMLVARNLGYLSQVQSTIRYSRKLAALGRLSAGVAHEVKNPLNAMMIHLELLRQQVAPRSSSGSGRATPARGTAAGARAMIEGGSAPVARSITEGRSTAVTRSTADGGSTAATRSIAGRDSSVAPRTMTAGPERVEGRAAVSIVPQIDAEKALEHVDIIANEIRRLDQVMQGFLKFSRPEDLKLQPVQLSALIDEVIPIVRPEAERAGVELIVGCRDVPDVNGDPAMLRQAFLNLAFNACQAMPNGGTLQIRCEPAPGRRVSISFADTGAGIEPEHLQRIFDLYFTTKEKGSGIGLSMVYRTVQMHDGEIEVQSTPGAGSTFCVLLPEV